MKQVKFTNLIDADADDIRMLASNERALQQKETADRVLDHLREMEGANSGFQIDRLQHSLQTATRVLRDHPEDDALVVCALVHDIGELMAPVDHPSFAAAIVRPYVPENYTWMVMMHGVFQGYYYWEHLGRDPNGREQYKDHPAYDLTVEFCEKYDAPSFDPNYETLPLEAFEPAVRRVFSKPGQFKAPRG